MKSQLDNVWVLLGQAFLYCMFCLSGLLWYKTASFHTASLIIPVPNDIIVLKIIATGNITVSYTFSHFPTMVSDAFCLWWACFVCVRLLNLTGWMIILSGLDQDTDPCSIHITHLLTWPPADESATVFFPALKFLNPIHFSAQKQHKIWLLGTDHPM